MHNVKGCFASMLVTCNSCNTIYRCPYPQDTWLIHLSVRHDSFISLYDTTRPQRHRVFRLHVWYMCDIWYVWYSIHLRYMMCVIYYICVMYDMCDVFLYISLTHQRLFRLHVWYMCGKYYVWYITYIMCVINSFRSLWHLKASWRLHVWYMCDIWYMWYIIYVWYMIWVINSFVTLWRNKRCSVFMCDICVIYDTCDKFLCISLTRQRLFRVHVYIFFGTPSNSCNNSCPYFCETWLSRIFLTPNESCLTCFSFRHDSFVDANESCFICIPLRHRSFVSLWHLTHSHSQPNGIYMELLCPYSYELLCPYSYETWLIRISLTLDSFALAAKWYIYGIIVPIF